MLMKIINKIHIIWTLRLSFSLYASFVATIVHEPEVNDVSSEGFHRLLLTFPFCFYLRGRLTPRDSTNNR